MEYQEGRLPYPIGELIPGPFGEMEGKKTKAIQDNEKRQIEKSKEEIKKAESVVKVKKVQIFK